MKRIGVDIDGCLADFLKSYISTMNLHAGIKMSPPNNDFPPEWNFEVGAGMTPDQISYVWKNYILHEGSSFWETLSPLEHAKVTILRLNYLAKLGHDVYYLTHRSGDKAKFQTEKWLYNHGMDYPTVLLSGDKFPLIKSLGIDVFIDDKLDTIYDIAVNQPIWNQTGKLYLKDAAYNRHDRTDNMIVVGSVKEMLEKEGLWE